MQPGSPREIVQELRHTALENREDPYYGCDPELLDRAADLIELLQDDLNAVDS